MFHKYTSDWRGIRTMSHIYGYHFTFFFIHTVGSQNISDSLPGSTFFNCFLLFRRRTLNCTDNYKLSILSCAKSKSRTLSDNTTQEMIFRGTDTVAILLEWIMARMVAHPEIQAKARQELEKCTGNHRQVQDSDIPNLPYLQAIVKEVLRLHPPGPLLSWARLAIHDVHVDKLLIPAGTTAMVNMWAITHDPSIWRDPWAFNPDRFMEEDVLIMGSDLRLAPFGSGRRVCPGKALGLATVHLWLARLLHEYRWLPAKPVDLSECLRLSLEMKRPLECRAVPWSKVIY
ncbi:hypothetical protein OIU76_017436 [Salix suchowensis]|nr:hypothetical protein OIU76_017436 [Salix suchowensis]